MQKENTLSWHWFDEVWNQASEEAIDRMMAPDAVIHGIQGISEVGAEGFKIFQRGFFSEFSNIRVEVKQVVREDDMESSFCEVSAIHIPSGRPVNFTGHTTVRIVNDQIIEGWNSFDFMSMYQQLGFTLQASGDATAPIV